MVHDRVQHWKVAGAAAAGRPGRSWTQKGRSVFSWLILKRDWEVSRRRKKARVRGRNERRGDDPGGVQQDPDGALEVRYWGWGREASTDLMLRRSSQ